MALLDTYETRIPDWATSVEGVAPLGGMNGGRLEIHAPANSLFLVATVSTPEGQRPNWLGGTLGLADPLHDLQPGLVETDSWYANPSHGLFVLTPPNQGKWTLTYTPKGSVPFAIHCMVFHPAIPPNSPPSPGPAGSPPFKCRACRTTAKALALSIVAAATLPALPAALIAAVASFLGASVVVAAAFISSVLGDTVDAISVKLCQRVGLC